MSDYRNVQTRMWRADEWFMELPTDARLFWIYLFTNPSARVAGIYRLPARTMAFESGLSAKRIDELKQQFSKDGKAHFERDIVWVVKMRELQSPGKISPQLQAGIDRDIEEIPYCALKREYLLHYGYPIDTLPIPATTAQHSTAQHNTEGEAAEPPAPAKKPTELELFKQITGHAAPRVSTTKIRATIGETPNADFLRTCFQEWVERGYKPANLAWLFDWYANGKIPDRPGRSNGNGRDNQYVGIASAENGKRGRAPEPTEQEQREWDEAMARIAAKTSGTG